MNREELRKTWEKEEEVAHIKGWDFSHIDGRCKQPIELPWNYENVVRKYLKPEMKLLDYDTGGGEFLLSLGHPYNNTAATEGYPPNVELCKEKLIPLGIELKACDDPANIPFPDESFDIVINRHGSFNAAELHRILKKGGIFVTQQVGSENDRDLVRRVLPNIPEPFPHLNVKEQGKCFRQEGFEILMEDEAFGPIEFSDIGAFVWFAHVIEWEFPGFSVAKCFDKLVQMQEEIEKNGKIEGTIHRYLIVCRK